MRKGYKGTRQCARFAGEARMRPAPPHPGELLFAPDGGQSTSARSGAFPPSRSGSISSTTSCWLTSEDRSNPIVPEGNRALRGTAPRGSGRAASQHGPLTNCTAPLET